MSISNNNSKIPNSLSLLRKSYRIRFFANEDFFEQRIISKREREDTPTLHVRKVEPPVNRVGDNMPCGALAKLQQANNFPRFNIDFLNQTFIENTRVKKTPFLG